MQPSIDWRSLHWHEYGAELLGTAINLFVGLSAIVFDFAHGLPMEHLIPNPGTRLLITGLIFAGSGSLVAISPLGKLSGAHLNPSISLAFWAYGKMHRQDFIGYIVAQFLGAVIGVFLMNRVWGNYANSVDNGMTLPGAGYSLLSVFLAEVFITFLLIILISLFVSNARLMRWTPLMVWLLIATMVWQEVPISGTSLNTARSFAPALITRLWKDQWIYAIAPPLGALLAVAVFRVGFVARHDILTGKLFHVPHYRCIFKNVKASHRY